MAHKVLRLSRSLLNKPFLIQQDKLTEIYDYLDSRNKDACFETDDECYESGVKGVVENGVGTLHIQGPLTAKPTGYEFLCGGMNYEQIRHDMDTFVAQGAKVVFMDVDSGGGEAHTCFETARYVRKLADENDIKLVAYVNGMSASAAYALTSVADEVIANPTSDVGSIGVVIALEDRSEQLKMEGIKPIYITSTNGKVPFDEDGHFKAEFIKGLQEDVDYLHEGFASLIEDTRGIPSADVTAMQSKLYRADQALSNKLIDKTMTVEDFYDYLASLTDTKEPIDSSHDGVNEGNLITMDIQGDTPNMSDNLSPDMLEKMAQFDAMQEELTKLKAEKAKAQMESLTAQVEKYSLAESNVAPVVNMLAKGGKEATLLANVLDDMQSALDAKDVANKEALDAKDNEIAELKASVEDAKAEFAMPKGVEGDNVTEKDTEASAEKPTLLKDFLTKKYNSQENK